MNNDVEEISKLNQLLLLILVVVPISPLLKGKSLCQRYFSFLSQEQIKSLGFPHEPVLNL